MQRLQALPEHDEQEERQHPGSEPDRVRRREGYDLGWLVGQPQDRAGHEQDPDRRHGQDDREQHPALDAASHRGGILRAHRLGHDGVEHHQRPHPEDADAEEVEMSQRDGGEADRRVAGRQVPDHHGVDDAHEHHAHLHEHDGHRQAEHRAQLAGPGEDPAGQSSRCHRSGGNGGTDGVLGGTRAREQALGEIDPLGELGDLLAELVQLVEHLGGHGAARQRFLGVPPPDEAALRRRGTSRWRRGSDRTGTTCPAHRWSRP